MVPTANSGNRPSSGIPPPALPRPPPPPSGMPGAQGHGHHYPRPPHPQQQYQMPMPHDPSQRGPPPGAGVPGGARRPVPGPGPGPSPPMYQHPPPSAMHSPSPGQQPPPPSSASRAPSMSRQYSHGQQQPPPPGQGPPPSRGQGGLPGAPPQHHPGQRAHSHPHMRGPQSQAVQMPHGQPSPHSVQHPYQQQHRSLSISSQQQQQQQRPSMSQPSPSSASQQSGGPGSGPGPSGPLPSPSSHGQQQQQGGQQQQQHYLPASLNGDWQSNKDMQHRREMIQHIVRLLKQKDKNASQEWLNKLPQMVKQLEVSLYRSAPSFEAYADTSTLKHRLQLLAMEIARKTQQAKSGGGGQQGGPPGPSSGDSSAAQQGQGPPRSASRQQQQQQQGPGSNGVMRPPPLPSQSQRQGSSSASNMPGSSPGMMGAPPPSSSSKHNGMGPPPPSSSQRQPSASQRGNSTSGDSRRSLVVNMNEINPMMGGSGGGIPYGGSSPGMGMPPSQAQQDPKSSRPPVPPSSDHENKNDPDWQIRIRHKQQRLLLLHHASKCPQEAGRCTVTAHCADMKRLWKHMARCTDTNCRVSHCFSSRSILSHYRKCKDPQCPACGPVRETVRKSQGGGKSSSGGGSVTTPPSSYSSSQGIGMGNVGGGGGGGMMNPMSGGRGSSGQNFPGIQQASTQPNLMGPSSKSTSPPDGLVPGSSNSVTFSSSTGQPPGQFRQGSSSGRQPSSSSSSMPQLDFGMSSSNVAMSSSVKIRHKQQRLLLLRHASKCPYEDGRCPVTQNCASMKRLWKHISDCKDQTCKVQHCMSSRYVLSHYRRCKDPRCPACEPVRESIRKSSLKPEQGKDSTQQQRDSTMLDPALLQLPSSGGQQQHGADAPFSGGSSVANQPPPKRAKIQSSPSTVCQPISSAGPAPPSSATAAAPSAADKSKVKTERSASTASGASSSKSDETTAFSLINSFTVEQIETHIASLNRTVQLPPAKLKAKCLDLLRGLQTHEHGWVFNCPVDPVELGLPDYLDIIKRPMDLGTIQKKLERGEAGTYHSLGDFSADVNLTFDNAMLYNEEGSVVHNMAKELKTKFVADHRKLLNELKKEEEERRQNDRACSLCGCEKLLFEPPVYFCNGMNCSSKRIRRNSHYFVGGGGQYYWCNQCYNELDARLPIEVGDLQIKKDILVKKKNDEVHEESWVQCDSCERWIHQICGLFNARQNKEHKSEYNCPHCLLKLRKREKAKVNSQSMPTAENLPRTKLSELLENHVRNKVEERRQTLAKERAQTENIPLTDALKGLSLGGPITIRQVTSTDRKLEVRERMRSRYAHKKYPDEFPFRCKCVVVFQNLDGVDTILFALYVYEHGEDNPAPNKRTVYISYLDSVHFMRPRKMRTFVYHEILIAYLDYVRNKGFATAHIWACPPLKGDDYIFYAKPEDQKTPKDTRLRMWYIDMLVECQRRGVCGKVTNMYDQYFANEKLDATAVPYLEGDYFPGEAENIIKDLEDGKGGKGNGGGKKSKKKKTNNSASAAVDDKPKAKTKSGNSVIGKGKDEVMGKLGDIIQPMKDSFIVAFLNWDGATEEQREVPKEIMEFREKARQEKANDPEKSGSSTEIIPSSDAGDKKPSESRKRDANGNARVVSVDSSNAKSASVDSDGNPIKIIDDDLEELDCEFLNNRQAFLNLCRGNHYQFDELRRAKHTSMMVLWHLHNRGAPKFVQQCASCSREILSGTRYHCSTCPDFDLCEECFKNPKANRGACTHKLEPIAVEADTSQDGQGGGASGLTEAQRKERQRNIQLHIQLIEHASRCNSSSCSSNNCAKMKSYLKHGAACKIRASGGCKICKRIWTLLRIHAQHCKLSNCPMPQCMNIRERIRQLAKQQQAMDDRRRQEMNRHYQMSRQQNR